MNQLDIAALPGEAWRPSRSISGRATNRVSERELERIPAWIRLGTNSERPTDRKIPVRLWDYSLFGFAVSLPYSRSDCEVPQNGDRAELILDFGEGRVSADCRVENTAVYKNSLRIGLSRADLGRVRTSSGANPIQGEYIRLNEMVELRAEARNPVLFGEWAVLHLQGVRKGLQLDFISKDPGLPVFLGLRMELRFIMPTTGSNAFLAEVAAIERVFGNALKIGMKVRSISSSLANDLAEYLVFEAEVPPGAFKRFGFPTRFLKNRVTFRFLETMEEYAEVLALRRAAYVDAGKKVLQTQPEEMSLSKDRNSRILCAYHDKTLIASAAITFPSREEEVLRSESVFPNGKYPIEHPPKAELLEVNSLCTHRDYRRGDLLHAMFEQIARIFVLSGRTTIMNLVETALLPVYLGIGFQDTGVTCDFLGRTHHLIRTHRKVVTHASGIGLLRWNLLFGDLMEDILRKKMFPFNAWDRFCLHLRLAFKPLARRWVGKRYESAFRRDLGEMENESDG